MTSQEQVRVMDELLPCPDGHKTVQLAQWPNALGEWRQYVFCTCCGWRSGGRETEHEAIAAWNTRQAAEAEAKAREAELTSAALALYMMGRWELPISKAAVEEQAAAWERLRDVLGLEPGHATNAGIHA